MNRRWSGTASSVPVHEWSEEAQTNAYVQVRTCRKTRPWIRTTREKRKGLLSSRSINRRSSEPVPAKHSAGAKKKSTSLSRLYALVNLWPPISLRSILTRSLQPTWRFSHLRAHWMGVFNIASSLENLANSIFWLIPCVVKMIQKIGGYETLFHNCCHGGLRRKLTKWWNTHSIFDELAAICENDGSHEHLDWKPVPSDNELHYPTSSEAACPFLLCTRLVDSVKSRLTEAGALDPPASRIVWSSASAD